MTQNKALGRLELESSRIARARELVLESSRLARARELVLKTSQITRARELVLESLNLFLEPCSSVRVPEMSILTPVMARRLNVH